MLSVRLESCSKIPAQIHKAVNRNVHSGCQLNLHIIRTLSADSRFQFRAVPDYLPTYYLSSIHQVAIQCGATRGQEFINNAPSFLGQLHSSVQLISL